jgi:hypothetical protein
MSKRSIIILVVALAVLAPLVLGGIAVVAGGGDDSRRVGAIKQAFVGGKYVLQGPSGSAVPLKSYEGCRRKADVSRAPDTAGVVRKEIAGVLEEPCVVRFGLEGSEGLWQVVDGMLKGTAAPQNYILAAADFNYKVTGGVQLLNARPTKFVIPQFDAEKGKESVTFELWLQPTSLTPLPATQIGNSIGGNVQAKASKAASLGNFGVELGSLPTTRVNKFGPIEVRRTPGKLPEIDVGDVALSMSTIDSPAVHAWFEDFVIKGNNSPGAEKTASLQLLAPNLKDVLATFVLSGVGIIDVFDVPSSGGDKVKRTVFSVYAEELSLASGLVAPSPAPSPTPTPTPPPPPPPPSETTEPAPPAETKLAAPAEIKGSASGRSAVELAWNAVDGADSYIILAALSTREDERPAFNEVTESTETSILIGDLRPGTYLFVVRARAGETESPNSPAVEIVVE